MNALNLIFTKISSNDRLTAYIIGKQSIYVIKYKLYVTLVYMYLYWFLYQRRINT